MHQLRSRACSPVATKPSPLATQLLSGQPRRHPSGPYAGHTNAEIELEIKEQRAVEKQPKKRKSKRPASDPRKRTPAQKIDRARNNKSAKISRDKSIALIRAKREKLNNLQARQDRLMQAVDTLGTLEAQMEEVWVSCVAQTIAAEFESLSPGAFRDTPESNTPEAIMTSPVLSPLDTQLAIDLQEWMASPV